jgi:hypothetical protein
VGGDYGRIKVCNSVKEGPTIGGRSMAQEEGGVVAMVRWCVKRRRCNRRLG